MISRVVASKNLGGRAGQDLDNDRPRFHKKRHYRSKKKKGGVLATPLVVYIFACTIFGRVYMCAFSVTRHERNS